MQVLFGAVPLVLVLVLLGCSAAADECDLPSKPALGELQTVLASRWVLVDAFSDYPDGKQLLRLTNSSLVQMMQTKDNETFLFSERNVVGGKCLNFKVNMTYAETSNYTLRLVGVGVKEYDGVESPYDDQGRVDVYQSCPDCLLIIYSGVFEGTPGRMMLIYRKEGKHLDADELKAAEDGHRKWAECLKFDVSVRFRYDGKAEFCVEKKEEGKES
ncbi:saxitoxin and tetrodotoxin-binding protein 2-like [Brachyistius frenatus]|uniref:saxitoxin and tetrodotoxin-binding protein 2-like n=1 Tax=Brachyistius frenatus TaxID=100188 RepID=UPI0037E97A20